jgi:hypothetical protein
LRQLLKQVKPGKCGGKGGGATRGPQSMQSVPYRHTGNSAPGPPSSHSLSEVYTHVSEQTPGALGGAVGGEGGGGGRCGRLPQSMQSVP